LAGVLIPLLLLPDSSRGTKGAEEAVFGEGEEKAESGETDASFLFFAFCFFFCDLLKGVVGLISVAGRSKAKKEDEDEDDEEDKDKDEDEDEDEDEIKGSSSIFSILSSSSSCFSGALSFSWKVLS
jgi:hypothetical protein